MDHYAVAPAASWVNINIGRNEDECNDTDSVKAAGCSVEGYWPLLMVGSPDRQNPKLDPGSPFNGRFEWQVEKGDVPICDVMILCDLI